MHKKTRWLIHSTLCLALAFGICPAEARGATLRTSVFGGDLAAAIHAASEGDRIIVDVPSFPSFPGGAAFVDKRLAIVGAPGGFVEGRFFVLAGASGSALRHLDIRGSGFGIGINGGGSAAFPGANDVTVAHCTIDGFWAGIRGRFADRWHVHQNSIIVSDGGFSLGSNVAGIVLNAGVDGWSIHTNTILAELKGVYMLNAAPDPTAIADVVIMNNTIMTSDPDGAGVFLWSFGAGGLQEAIEIKHNDLTGMSVPVLVFALSVTEDPRADPGAFVLDSSNALGVIENLNVRKNSE